MTLREQIGQMFMVGVSGETLTPVERSTLAAYHFGGVVLFGRNLAEPKQILSLCRSLWNAASDPPPFIAIDAEGGRVHRLPTPFTHFPAATVLGRKRDPELARRVGRATARELALVGINFNFAPVLDVNSNPKNPIIGDRSFGSAPDQVIAIGEAWIGGLRDGGVIPCGKHFPGHGGTDADSHLELPVVDKQVAELRALELPPFFHACRNRIESLMTAHVLYPALDRDFPATLSRAVLESLLRREMGYDGVVFTDDMGMNAIMENYPLSEAVIRAVRAGVDVILYCHNLAEAICAAECLRAETAKDPEIRARVEQSCRRIDKLKRSRIAAFSGAVEGELTERLARFRHQRIVAQIQGSL